jgi:hypothetical protein
MPFEDQRLAAEMWTTHRETDEALRHATAVRELRAAHPRRIHALRWFDFTRTAIAAVIGRRTTRPPTRRRPVHPSVPSRR